MFGNASTTTPAVLTPDRFPNHALYTEIVLVEFPKVEKLFNDLPLTVATGRFGHVPWILQQRNTKEVCREGIRYSK